MADTVTFRQMLQEMQRELSMRHHVYKRRVADRKMTQAAADKQTAIIVALIAHLQPLADAEKAQEAAAEPSFLDI